MDGLPKPSKKEVEKYLKLWSNSEKDTTQEKSLDKMFLKDYAENKKLEDILIKCSVLNDFYSTNIYSVFPVAKHIQSLGVDKRLKNGDISLVNDIAKVNVSGKERNYYSFATKYCSHHNPTEFPIYDSYVEKVLMYYKKADKFYEFKKDDLKDYAKFKEVLIAFKKYYNLDEFNLKELDMYLWQLGKEYFPNKY